MILQALSHYYQRKAADPSHALAPEGFERKAIPFLIVIDTQGRFVQLEDTRTPVPDKKGKPQLQAKTFLVPQGDERSGNKSYEYPFLFWDNIKFVIGIDKDGTPTENYLQHFKKRITETLDEVEDEHLNALRIFYDNFESNFLEIKNSPKWPELVNGKIELNVSFKLAIDNFPVFERSSVIEYIKKKVVKLRTEGEQGICLVSGELTAIRSLHTKIKGLPPPAAAGANLVSFNDDAYCSYGKSQGLNAPTSARIVFEYTTALNHLLRKDSKQKFQTGDVLTVFWSKEEHKLEEAISFFFEEDIYDDPDARTDTIRGFLRAVHTGAYVEDGSSNIFYLLSLSADTKSRVTIRNWQVSTVKSLSVNIAQYFEDIKLEGLFQNDFPALKPLLATAFRRKSNADRRKSNAEVNIPSGILSGTLQAIFRNDTLPHSLFQAVLSMTKRIKSLQVLLNMRGKTKSDFDQIKDINLLHALLKACLNRHIRKHQFHTKPFHMALDPQNPNPGYQLGRLFAVLEKAQKDALGDINATIRDRYYGAASSTPAAVFPQLLRLKNHHLAKIGKEKEGKKRFIEDKIIEIIGHLQAFPGHMSIQDQGAFALGYYHQTQDFYTKKDKTENPQ
jgi:CRISPR-associated protein Csd1